MSKKKKKVSLFWAVQKDKKKRMNFKAMHTIMTFIKTNYGHGLA